MLLVFIIVGCLLVTCYIQGRLIVVCVLGPVDVVLGSIIAGKFFTSKKLIFRTVGGNAALQSKTMIDASFQLVCTLDYRMSDQDGKSLHSKKCFDGSYVGWRGLN